MRITHMDRYTTAILFDIDGCLISTGGAGARAWRHAFESLHGIPADIGQFSEAGMTDPDLGRLTFENVIGRDPSDREMARLMSAYLDHLTVEVEQSPGYRVMPGVVELLPRLVEIGALLGLTSGALEAGAHIKLESSCGATWSFAVASDVIRRSCRREVRSRYGYCS